MPRRRHGLWVRRALTAALLALGVGLWIRHLQGVDWRATRGIIAAIPPNVLLAALGFACAAYAVYASYDLLGRRAVRAAIAPRLVWTIGLVSHACGLNLGPAGVGFRLRLYLRHGLNAAVAAGLWVFNVATNWLGLLLLAGAGLATLALPLAQAPAFVVSASQPVGYALLGAVGVYLLACALAHGRAWTVRGRRVALPSFRLALLQCLFASTYWCLLAGLITVLLQQRAGFPMVLAALMANALALALVDVPGGLGVTETVFVAMLTPQVPTAELLAALLAYRAIFFVGPLVAALVGYVLLEFDAATLRARWASWRSRRISDPP